MNNAITLFAIAMALLTSAPAFARDARPAASAVSTAAAGGGHTDPELAQLIGIEPTYIFPGNPITAATTTAIRPESSRRPSQH